MARRAGNLTPGSFTLTGLPFRSFHARRLDSSSTPFSGAAEAPPFLMLPGISSPGLTFVANVEPLSQRYRTFAVDCIWDHNRSVASKPVTCPDDFPFRRVQIPCVGQNDPTLGQRL
jgi:hypothetical protein